MSRKRLSEDLRNMESHRRRGAGGLRGPRAASGSPVGDRRPSQREPVWMVRTSVIDRERVLHGWTQRALAHAAHVDAGTVSDALAGRRRPNLATLSVLCQALGLTLGDVVQFRDNP